MDTYFRRDQNVEPPPGTLVAEFANGVLALDFLKLCLDDTYTVTAGVNLPYAIRKRIPESVAAAHGADSAAALPTASGAAAGFSLHALTNKGREKLPEIERLIKSLELQ